MLEMEKKTWQTLQLHVDVCHSEMGEATGVFTLKAQFIPLGNIFGVDKSHAKELSESFVLFDVERGGTKEGRQKLN